MLLRGTVRIFWSRTHGSIRTYQARAGCAGRAVVRGGLVEARLVREGIGRRSRCRVVSDHLIGRSGEALVMKQGWTRGCLTAL